MPHLLAPQRAYKDLALLEPKEVQLCAAYIHYLPTHPPRQAAELVGIKVRGFIWQQVQLKLDVRYPSDLLAKYRSQPHFNLQGKVSKSRLPSEHYQPIFQALKRLTS